MRIKGTKGWLKDWRRKNASRYGCRCFICNRWNNSIKVRSINMEIADKIKRGIDEFYSSYTIERYSSSATRPGLSELVI